MCRAMSLDLFATVLFLAFVLLGAFRGALTSGAGLVSLVIAYTLAVFAAGHFGPSFAERLGTPELISTPLVGTVAFFVSYGLAGLVSTWLRRWDRVVRAGVPRGPVDRFVGGVFGALRGALVVLLISWLALWLDAARGYLDGAWIAAAPDTSDSRAAAATGALVARAVEGAIGDDSRGARVAARMAGNPREAIESLQGLLDDERVRAIQQDDFFWTLVENGAAGRAVHRGSFAQIAADDGLREQLAGLGVISEEAAESASVFREDAARALDELGPRLKGLSNDPELQALAGDPQITAMLESGDTMGLLGHEGVRKLAARLGAGL